MTETSAENQAPNQAPTRARSRRWAPAVVLLVLAPVVTEVLYGSTTLFSLFVLLPEIGTYGVVALLARAAVRRRGLGWTALLALGVAWALVEEFVVIQTSVSPLLGVPVGHTYGGRALGVSWVYLVFAVGYESVWPMLVSVQLTELLFPSRRAETWVDRRGAIVAAVAFVPSALIAWVGWTRFSLPTFLGHPYTPPLVPQLVAVVVVVAIVAAVLTRRARPVRTQASTPPPGRTPSAWLVGVAVGVLASAWMALALVAYGAFSWIPVWATYAGAAVVAAASYLFVRRWSRARGWTDAHRLGLVAGALAGNMLLGVPVNVGASGGSVAALVFKLVVDLLAVVLLVRIGLRLRAPAGARSRTRPRGTAGP